VNGFGAVGPANKVGPNGAAKAVAVSMPKLGTNRLEMNWQSRLSALLCSNLFIQLIMLN
jgi:hypothetical protein